MANSKKPTGFNLIGTNEKYGFKTIPNESVSWRLQAPDGKYFGDVSYDAFKAVEGGTLDSYKAKDKKEEDIISEFRKYPGIDLKSQDGSGFGKISYDAYRAIVDNKIENYNYHSESEKKAISAFQNYAEEQAKEERINSNPVFKRYNIDPANFDTQDFVNWLDDNNMELTDVSNSQGLSYRPKKKGAFLGVIGGKNLATDQQIADADVLYELQGNNYRKQLAQGDQGAFWSLVSGFGDGLFFGGLTALGNQVSKVKYENAGLDPEAYVSPKQAWGATTAEHPVANFAGNMSGSLVSLGPLSKGVSAATKGVGWIAKSPQWVQTAINSGITFSIAGGAETAFDGGSLKDVLISAGTNFVGGAVGGALSSKVGAVGEKILFNKGLQHKIIPEMIRNGFSSAAFAGGKVASTYFLYPEEYKPTAEEMVKDIGVAFAFGAISSGINTMKASAQNKKYLDDLYQKMASDYENMAKANISSESDISGIRKFAKNVVGYSNAMEAYLTGKEFSATIDGNIYTFTPNKVRLVGQDKYVNSILSELQTIRNNANAVLNGVGTPTTDLATTTPTSSTTAPAIDPILPSGSTPTGDTHTPVPPIVSVPPVNSAVTSSTPAAVPSASAIDTGSPVTPASASGELDEILGTGEITKFTPESASGEIKRLENILIAKGADDVSRQEIIGAAFEIEKVLAGSDKTIRSVFNNVSKITSGVITEIKNKAGVSGAYWKLFGENFKAIPSGSVTDNVELITEYATAYTEALKSNNPEKYNSVIVSADGTDLSAELPQTIMQNVIPANVQNAGSYRLVATQIKNIVSDVDVQISGERAEIYGAETNTTPADAEIVSADTVPTEPKNISLTRVGDFYEAYGDEAVELANKLNLSLTPKTINGEKVQMVGFPVHALENYTNALGSDYNVVIADNSGAAEITSVNAEKMPVTVEKEPVTSIEPENVPVNTDADSLESEPAKKAKKPFTQSEVKTLVKGNRKPCIFEIEGAKFVTEGHIALKTDGSGIEFLNNAVNEYYSSVGGMQTITADNIIKLLTNKVIGTVNEFIPYSVEESKGAVSSPANICIVGGLAHIYDAKFVAALKKRSSTLKIMSGENIGSTLLVGYDTDGRITGFAMPIMSRTPEYKHKDGSTTPFASDENLKALVNKTDKSVIETPDSVTKTPESVTKEPETVTDTPESVKSDTEPILKLTDKCTLTETKHTNEDRKIWVVTLNDRVSTDDFKELLNKVKSVGGYYSRFTKTLDGKAIPGFVFKAEPTTKEIKVFNDFFESSTESNLVAEETPATETQSVEPTTEETREETHTPKIKEDFKVGDVLEFDGEQWECVNIDSMMIDFVNVDKNAFQQNMSVILPYELFKEKTDYKVISKNATPEASARTEKNVVEKATKNEDVLKNEPGDNIIKSEGTKQIADYVAAKLAKGEKITALELSKISSNAFGGSMADNAYSIKDAYDAMELGVNQHILSMEDVSAEKMLELLELLPTQTKRTEDMIKYQQFSTPPSIAYLANYAANVNANDITLEPSAGIGGIAVFAKKDGAAVYVNELDERRLSILKNLPFDGFFNENAEQLDNILGGQIEPTVIVMNPPFSSSSERNIQNTKIGAKHIEQALKILAPNGRLVAIVGHGMGDGAPAFRSWWKDIKSKYNVRANIRINGKNYNKYGTNFDIQMLVIDKNGATTHTETGYVDTLQELQEKLGGIRDERPTIDYSTNEQRTPATTRAKDVAERKTADIGSSTVSDTSSVANKGKSADNANLERQPERKGVQSTDADSGKPAISATESTDVVANKDRGLGTGQQSGPVGNQNPVGVGDSDSGQSDIQTRRAEPKKRVKHKELTDSIFEHYQTQPLRLNNTQPHPAKVSESAAMSAIEPPVVTYKPNIPQSVVENGVLSDVQLEAISYAGQSHSQTLPNGNTRGFFLGDGTGIGKGRTIAGMMLDNYNQGRKKSLWVTLNSSLVNDAKRDVKALFGDSDLVTQFVGGNKADSVLNTDEAIMVISYSALSKGFDSGNSNFEKIVKWLGKDFDGLIVFDEAHKMGNATATKGTRGVKKASQTGLAGIALQEALPKAKIVYSSATGATEVENLRYAERLGLWGDGTAFVTGDDFVSKIKAGGLAAMELIARDMKAMGVYLSRNISYEDVRYDKITHKLTGQQKKIYDELARSWQIVLNNINKALDTTNQSKDGTARGRALGAFWSSQQRFFNQILTSMQVPSVIVDIEKQLADGKSCVIQLVSTNEAAQNEEFARLKAEDLELDEFDLTPKQMLMSYIENSFPVQQFEEYRDDEGNVRSKPVYDSKGNPVMNREAVRQREELLAKLGSIKVPSSPIDMIINHFGTDMVAENTGRARRVVQKDGKFIEEKIGSKKDADVDAFQNGNKRIIIFSKAGGTGKSYHADRAAKNQQQRVHYLLEAGWQADNAVQGFGRSHRSNQASAPIFKLVTTDLKGQMRFISTIAKRLDQLGAMTKGQRQAGGQGMFSASDNLENSFAADVLAVFYKDLIANRVDGIDNGLAIIEKLGLKEKIVDDYNRIIVTAPELREVNKFLNRILSLESSEQNTVFDGYSERLQDATEKAMLAGTLDKGLENYKADKITLNEVQDIREDERSGAKTKYYNLTAEHKIKPVRFEDIVTDSKSFVGFYQNKTTGVVRAVMQTSSSTDQYGNVTNNYKLVGQVKNDYIAQNRFYGNWTKIEPAEAEKLWDEELSKLPEFRKESLHLISGVVLPVWDKLPTENVRIYRVLTSDGEMLIGRVVSEDMIDGTLKRLGSSRAKEKIATTDLVTGIKNGDTVHLENDWRIVQRKVSGENRIELVGPSYEHYDLLTQKGVFTERIQYNTRYFIPADTNTVKIIDAILKLSPVMRVENAKYALSTESEGLVSEREGNDLLPGNGGRRPDESARKQTGRFSEFKQKIKGKTTEERQRYSKELLEKGLTEEKIDGNHKFHMVKPEGYNDDMLSIVNEAQEKGKEVGFFVGNGQRKFDGQKDFLIDGIHEDDSKILLRYDGYFSPQTLMKHEEVHDEWDTPEMQKAKDVILNDISDAEKKQILSKERYKKYLALYKGKKDKVLEEFVADVFAGMNDYTEDYIDIVTVYWYEGKVVDGYNPGEYNNIMDAGGNEAVLDNVGFGNEYRLSESGELDEYGKENTSEKLGWNKNIRSDEASSGVDKVGHLQQEEPNTPRTRRVHRSGVSAEVITSSGLAAEQAQLKTQNEIDGIGTEYFVRAKTESGSKDAPFNTENTAYYPDRAFERNGIVIKDGVASFTEKRFEDLIEEYSVPTGGQLNRDYAKAYVAYVSPSDFLRLTAINEELIVLDTARYGALDVEVLRNNNVQNDGPYLDIDFEDGRVYAHNGRHRMVMLRDAGINKVAILVRDISSEQNKYKTKKHTDVVLLGQKFYSGESAPGKVTVDEIIPLSPNYRNEVREKFVDTPSDVKYTLSSAEADAEELTPERKKEIFEHFDKDRAGVDKPTQKQLWGERAAWVAHNMTRVFPNIPERGEKGTFFAEFRKSMIQWKNLPTTASFMVQDKLNKMTEGLTPEEFKTFSELVYFLDLQEEAQIQKERGYTEILLPNEITPSEVDAIVKVLNEEATENVQQALIKRQNIWEALKSQYIDLNRYIGFDTDGKFKRKNYYHHQVIEYMNNGGKGTGSREIGIKAGRGWLKERQGSTKAINTDFLAVEYKAMLQMQYDVYIAETLGRIKQQYDIKPQLENEAFKNNKDAINAIIHKEATGKDGNIILDSKGKPDSETYRQQQWYNSRIMFGFNGLFDLADRNELPTYDGEYARVVEALKRHDLNVPGLYKYVGVVASTNLPDNATDAQEQAVLNARTVLKYTSQKREWIKSVLADDYQTWETLAKSMSDTHTIHQPRRGNYFYTKTVVDEDAFNKAHNEMVLALTSGEVDLGNIDLNKLFTQYADTVRLTGAAYEQWVLPNEIVTTMDEIANPKQATEGAKVARSIVSAWKGWATSVNPLRTIKFGLRNLFGDLDAVIAGNPKVTMYSKKAVQDIYQAMRHKKYSPEYMEWIERGGYTSMIFANEMDSEMQDKLFSHLKDKQGVSIFKISTKLFEKYYNGVENVHNFREAILRYSAYLYFKETIKHNGGTVKDYVASNRYIVRGLNSVEDKAYQLSKDLLGAYDEVGKMGQTLRRYWIPFYSFTETNLKRYYRLFENIIASDDKIPKKAGKLLLKALMVNMLGLLMAAWNRLVMKEEDDKLPPSVRNVPHLTLGQFGDDIYAFRQLGSFSELLEWFGLDDYKWSSEDLTAPLDKAWGMVTPFLKMPVELVSGLNFYPSLTQPRAIRDKWQHFFNSLGVDDLYNEITGKPTKGAGEILKGSVVYSYDYKESAYYEILDIKREYQGKTDNTIYGIDAKSNALYYMKTAVRYKDKEAALKYLDEYFENGGTAKGIKQSFATLNPMYGFTSKDTAEKGEAFIASLTEDQKEKLKIAQDYYENDLMLPENVLAKLGKKDITDEEAKNVLRGYINAKCK